MVADFTSTRLQEGDYSLIWQPVQENESSAWRCQELMLHLATGDHGVKIVTPSPNRSLHCQVETSGFLDALFNLSDVENAL